MSDEHRIGGYRDPARPSSGDESVEARAEIACNKMLLDMAQDGPEMARGEPSSDVMSERRDIESAWRAAAWSRSELAAMMKRRLKVMGYLQPHETGRSSRSAIRIRYAKDRDADFQLFVRPHTEGEAIIVRHVPQEARRLLQRPKRAPDEVAIEHRWDKEHATRLARNAPSYRALGALEDVLDKTLALGSDGLDAALDTTFAIGAVANALEDPGAALDALRAVRAAAAAHLGEGELVAEMLNEEAFVLGSVGRAEEALRLAERAVAIARRGFVLDPLVAEAHDTIATIHRDAGDLRATAAAYRAAIEVVTELSGPTDRRVVAWRRELAVR